MHIKSLSAHPESVKVLVSLSHSIYELPLHSCVWRIFAMLKLRALAFLVCSLSAQVFTSPLNPVSLREVDDRSKRNGDIPIVDLHIVNKKIAPDGYEREYVSFQALNVGATTKYGAVVLYLPEGHSLVQLLQGKKYVTCFAH